MSAYIMTDDEINIIVSYFIEPMQARDAGAYVKVGDNYDYLNIMNSAQVAKILKDENIRSVNNRYNDNTESVYEFEYIPSARKRPVGNIIGALDCLEYQSCESDDWQTTNAWTIICQLRKHLLKQIAEREETYTWGIE